MGSSLACATIWEMTRRMWLGTCTLSRAIANSAAANRSETDRSAAGYVPPIEGGLRRVRRR
eukprot:459374-Pyramimonas_sp.AAC.1